MIKVPLNASTFGEEEIEAAVQVLRSSFVTMGKKCFEFEDTFAEYLGVKNAVFVNSGSSANLLAFFALANPEFSMAGKRRLMPGDEVIVPAVTWSTTIWPIVQAGGIPVLVDSDPKTLQMNLDAVKAAISPKTVGICPVHVLGNAVPMKELGAIAREHGLWLFEDTCEALGTKSDGKFVGTIGDVGTYSFFFSHHITTIEGGMVVTNDDNYAELLRCMRAHGWTRHLKNREAMEKKYSDIDPRFLFINTGFNVRPTEISAAFGFPQLRKLKGFNERRVEIANQWGKAFQPFVDKGHFTPMVTTRGTDSTYFGYPIVCRDREMRIALQAHLETSGIETRPVICGNLARQPAFKHIPHRIAGKLDGADKIMDCGLFWGSHPIMTQAEVDHVITSVNGFFNR
ncbi:MAG: DegT/DnrJ/EryC1/StrS family aminotransferase [Bdellovibrionota bacterium]